jgi:hypothetical protein
MNIKTYSSGTIAALLATGCGDWADSNLCPPWGNAVDCDHHQDDEGDSEGPEIVEESPCDQIGAALGLPLVPQDRVGTLPPYEETDSLGLATMGLAVPDAQMPYASWAWEILPEMPAYPSPGEPAVLKPYDQELWVSTSARDLSWAWVQTEHMQQATLRGKYAFEPVVAQGIAQADGSTIHYAYAVVEPAYVNENGWHAAYWDFEAIPFFPARLRGYARHVNAQPGAWAGPALSAMQSAVASNFGFQPTGGSCKIGDPGAADGGSGGHCEMFPEDCEGGSGGNDTDDDPLPATCDAVAEALGMPAGSLGWFDMIGGPELRFDVPDGVMIWDYLNGWTWEVTDLYQTAALDLGESGLGVEETCLVHDQEYFYIQLMGDVEDVAFRANLDHEGNPIEVLGVPIDYVIPASTLTLPGGTVLAAVTVDECSIYGRWEIAGNADVVGKHVNVPPGMTPYRKAGPLQPAPDLRPTVQDFDAFAPVMGHCLPIDVVDGGEAVDESGG